MLSSQIPTITQLTQSKDAIVNNEENDEVSEKRRDNVNRTKVKSFTH